MGLEQNGLQFVVLKPGTRIRNPKPIFSAPFAIRRISPCKHLSSLPHRKFALVHLSSSSGYGLADACSAFNMSRVAADKQRGAYK